MRGRDFSPLLLVALLACQRPPPPREPARLDRVLQVTHEAHVPVLVLFHAPWCHGCKQFFAKVLADPEVVAALGDTPVASYDVDTDVGEDAAIAATSP